MRPITEDYAILISFVSRVHELSRPIHPPAATNGTAALSTPTEQRPMIVFAGLNPFLGATCHKAARAFDSDCALASPLHNLQARRSKPKRMSEVAHDPCQLAALAQCPPHHVPLRSVWGVSTDSTSNRTLLGARHASSAVLSVRNTETRADSGTRLNRRVLSADVLPFSW